MVERTTTNKTVYDLPEISKDGWYVSCIDDDLCHIYNDELDEQETFITVMINDNKYCVDFISSEFKELEDSGEFFFPMVAESFIHEVIEKIN